MQRKKNRKRVLPLMAAAILSISTLMSAAGEENIVQETEAGNSEWQTEDPEQGTQTEGQIEETDSSKENETELSEPETEWDISDGSDEDGETEDLTGYETEAQTEMQSETFWETELYQTEESEELEMQDTEIGTEYVADTESEEETKDQEKCTCEVDSDNPWDHDWECQVFLDALLALCDCGISSENIEDHREDCAALLYMLELFEAENGGIMTFAMTETPSGTPIAGVGGWKRAAAQMRFSSDYYPVKFYPGISSLEYFNTSSGVILGNSNTSERYLYPKTPGQGGSFGAIYRKVLYYDHKWHDLKMTVAGYTSSVRCDNSQTEESYPYIAMRPTAIAWNFNQAFGGIVLKCEFFESGTSKKAAVNTRFQWWDVDGAQRFGLKAADGSVAGKYYYEGSPVYCQTGQTVAGIAGMEVVVGQGADTSTEDPRYCVTYELKNCSTYYMSLGERDHINDDNYSYTKATIRRKNEELASGSIDWAFEAEFLKQTDTSLSVIDTPAPTKKVSGNNAVWADSVELSSVTGEYWYRLIQFVPWQDSKAYYNSFVVKDVLPAGADYVGGLTAIREEDGQNVSSWFLMSESGDTVTITANNSAMSSAAFYGYHYIFTFKVRMDPTEISPAISGGRAVYSVRNSADTIVRQPSDSAYITKRSNFVTTTAAMERKEQEAPIKYFDEKADKTEKTLFMQGETITFFVLQTVPENNAPFYPSFIEMSDTLEDCLEYKDSNVKLLKKGESTYESVQGWNAQVSGQTVKMRGAFEERYSGGKLLFQITCCIRRNYDLTKWISGNEQQGVWTVIPNHAAVTFFWEEGSPSGVTKETNIVKVKLRENHIRLMKEIDTADIVWEHGNPVFTFKVEGTDLEGGKHTYYQTLEFTQSNAGNSAQAILTADFSVPAGTYTAAEEKTMRYCLKEIHDIKNGNRDGDAVVFHLAEGGDGEAVFYNEKTTDEDESHTVFVRNLIGK